MGNVIQAGLGQNPARQAALKGGLDPRVAAMTINKVCGSGLKSVALAAQAVALGESEIVVAGGMESMSNAPYLMKGARAGLRLGNSELLDSMITDGLWDVYENFHMGMTAELVAEKYGISRAEQDAYSVESHRRAVLATKSCFVAEPDRSHRAAAAQGAARHDQNRRIAARGYVARSARQAQARVQEGRRHCHRRKRAWHKRRRRGSRRHERAHRRAPWQAPIARIVAQAVSGVEPKWVMMAPVDAVEKSCLKTGWDRDKDVDLYELNEAFAVAAIAVTRELKIDPAKVNVNGGAVALGHPIGASGARLLVTLLYELQRRNLKRGIAALCLGGGNAVALAIERA